nr:GATA zinc finger domain-containing protein 8 [Onthophagus taurus]
MSKSMNMLRTRRRDNNVKPNRKLDRKSSRGMIYENEELRLKTININAEVERGQSDIKKLKRENEMLKKEMWCLRDAYDKLDKLIKEKEINFSSSSGTCSGSETESCSTCSSDSNEVETNQNLENVQKTNLKSLHVDFDHLSVVPEENSTENSDKNSIPNENNNNWGTNERNDVIKPDQSYPSFETLTKPTSPTILIEEEEKPPPKHFFSPINKLSRSCEGPLNDDDYVVNCYDPNPGHFYPHLDLYPPYENINLRRQQHNLNLMHPISKSSTDLIVKMDNHNFTNTITSSTFSNGGNLEELLNDIESISQDILKLSNSNLNYPNGSEIIQNETIQQQQINNVALTPSLNSINPINNEILEPKPYKSELNVVLMPTPMPLIGFDKYRNVQNSAESLKTKSLDDVKQENPFYFGSGNDYFNRYNPDNFINNGIVDKTKKNDLEKIETPFINNENDENTKIKTKLEKDVDQKKTSLVIENKKPEKQPKLSIRRKVSIHFKGKKTKNKEEKLSLSSATPKTPEKRNIFDLKFDKKHDLQKTPSLDSKKSTTLDNDQKRTSSETRKTPERKSSVDKTSKTRKSQSLSPEKHVQVKDEKKQHKKHKSKAEKLKNRRSTISNNEKFSNSTERFLRERSFSVCTDRSNIIGLGFNSAHSVYDDYLSERERTNSLSSCGTVKMRKMSNISNFPVAGKIPWCGCWGNGCL